jgi:predicted house-cleaning noncanonical NTP pyrophosphatase (MazG superfamily)
MKYYCNDCNCFVDRTHRCQQWETVYKIPSEALEVIKSEYREKLNIAIEALKQIAEMRFISDSQDAKMMAIRAQEAITKLEEG